MYNEYQNALSASNLLDYDDLLLRCAELLRGHPSCVSNVEAVLIDEYQDTNTIQFELMKLLASKNKRVTIFGDPDQSIYGFRSAEIQNLTRMQQYYPDTSIIHLEENYRSSAAVLRCAQEVIEQDTVRPNKRLKATHCYGSFPVLRRLPSPHDEAKWIVAEIKRLKALTGSMTKFSDYAILLRSAHLSLLIENALGKAGMPYRMVGGYRFFDREEIRTLLDYLRTISQPNNSAALSAIINVPSRKIGDESLKELLRLADEKGISLWAVVQKICQGDLAIKKKLSRPAEQNLCKLVLLVKDARKRMSDVPAESTAKFLLQFCIKRLAYREYLKSKHGEDYENRLANIEELLNQASDVAESASNAGGVGEDERLPDIAGVEQRRLDGNDEALASFLANITLSSDLLAKEDGQERDCLTISTIHAAKGLEWPVVFIPAVYDGSIPHSRAEDTDEERRLLYVAMTRAQALLYLSCPMRQSRGDAETTLSSFLPPKLHRYFIQQGPDITDKVVRDMALILRRPYPSQEELTKGLAGLSDRESSQDNLWPSDGSAKPRHWWDLKEEATSTQEILGPKIVRNDTFSVLQNHEASRTHRTLFETTMTSSASFTAAGSLVGFSTAAHYLEVNRTSQIQDKPKFRSTDEPARTGPARTGPAVSKAKKGEGKAAASQESLANFFARGAFGSAAAPNMTKLLPEPELPNCIDTKPTLGIRRLPVAISNHKISSKSMSLKRPKPLQDMPNAKRNKYVFLSSSPRREMHADQSSDICNGGEAKVSLDQEKMHTAVSNSVTSMHTTSMDVLLRQRFDGARKTYGVRRMMNGWENRKNK